MWVISKAQDGTPYAKSHDLERELQRLKREGHRWLVWNLPGGRPALYDVQRGERVAVKQAYQVLKADDEKRFTLGIVYVPDEPDAHGDFMRAEEIEEMAWRALASLARGGLKVGLEHQVFEMEDGRPPGIVVESYIARVPFEMNGVKVKEGSWVVGVVWHPRAWELVKSGRLRGFSFGGVATV